MEPSRFEREMTREELVEWCIEDRDKLKQEFFILSPRHEGQPPALWVEELLGALGHKVCFEPMEPKSHGLWDAATGHIFINSGLSLVRQRTTMAHELGHSRLHHREVTENVAAGLRDDDGYEARRRRVRENEANLYAAIFLVSREELERTEVAQRLLELRRDRQTLLSRELWSAVYSLAKTFHVSATLMMNCLVELGWLEKVPSPVRGRKYDLKIQWSVTQ